MALYKKQSLPFDKHGGVIVIQRKLIESNAYQALTVHAKALIPALQLHWRNEEPVAYGIREAMKTIPCAFNTARNAFNQLEKKGFIVKVDESIFNSRSGSKTRTWRLTWLPFNSRKPTNDWKKCEVIKLRLPTQI